MLIETLLRISFSVISRCSPVQAFHWLQWICFKFNCQRQLLVLFYHRRLPVCIFNVKIAAVGSLKWVTESIFKISKQFERSKLKKLRLFFNNKVTENCNYQQRICINYKEKKQTVNKIISWPNPFIKLSDIITCSC
jgi:hypothetical protein